MDNQNQNPLKRSFDAMTADESIPKPIDFSPRRYQKKVFDVAMKRNTLAVLETGAGKTMIAIMLIKDLPSSPQPQFIIFLAPTVHLVHQQFEVIKIHTGFRVECYYGAKGVDEWKIDRWRKEVLDNDVLVMTPAILLDALRKAYLNLEMMRLIIFDECHRATGNHCYTKIMKEFYHKSTYKPKIFGMTASPVIRKGVSSRMDCDDQLSELESILDSQIYTIEDRTELEVLVPSAKEINRFYDSTCISHLDLKSRLENSWFKFDDLLSKMQESVPSQYRDMDDKLKTLRKRLSNDYAKILHCLDDLGLVCAYEAVKVCIENAPKDKEHCQVYRDSYLQCKLFLEDVLCILGESLPNGTDHLSDAGFDFLKATNMGHISSKFHELLQIFHSFGEDHQVLCLIFIDRIITAKVVERVMKKITQLSHFTFSYLTGSNSSVDGLSPQLQKKTLESFRSGKVNLLFTTDVVEEGIHVPNCSCVIRFDLPKTVRSYVQSRGRARQSDSQFVMMLERGNRKQMDQLFDIIRSVRSMTETAINRDPDACILKPCTIKENEAYIVEATGASVTLDSSITLIQRYCEKLPGDKYFVPKPIYQFELVEDLYECKLTLPPNSAFQVIVGPANRNSHLSKQLVCLKACKKLHKMGALDDHLLPYVEEPSEPVSDVKGKESAAGAGTTKRKELHGTTGAHAMSGTWVAKVDDDIDFEAYKIDFPCNIPGNVYSGFVLLTESKLDDDVGNVEVQLYLTSNRVVTSSVSSSGQVHLTTDQVKKAKCFHEIFFNGLFGRLLVRSKSSGTQRELLLKKENISLWNSSLMYLLLPLESPDISNCDSWGINWRGISSCCSFVDFLQENLSRFSGKGGKSSSCKTDSLVTESQSINGGNLSSCKIESLVTECQSIDGGNSSSCETESLVTECKSIHLANKSVGKVDLKEMVVFAVHTGKIYSILDVLFDSSAETPFDGNSDAIPSEYATFAEYFQKKYGIALIYPRQPLLLLKQSHNPHNLLVNFNEDPSGNKQNDGKPQNHVHMPPELLFGVDMPITVLKSFYLLPSLMHRLESLMLASQLREEIGSHSNDFYISSSLMLEALTTLRCCESFSMERLELLGDSVLKYAVSCHLFLKYPKKHEGQLSAMRSRAVCNSNLHKLGTSHKLQGYIRDSAFEPRRWVAPGQRSIHPVSCSCGVESSEVPMDGRFLTEDTKVVVGKVCDRGHRWMGSKTIADCVEAVIGAFYVAGGLSAALHFMKWLGIGAEIEHSLVVEAINTASLRTHIPKANEIESLESKIGYQFRVKGLLLEAITHASEQELGVGYCYQRLEFLGDSVLDLLITVHLYQSHGDIDPGELTDLRSASVNNENFAQVAVRRNLQQHLQHCSGLLLSQITDYVKYISISVDITYRSLQGTKGPKALGDLVESIAGAILLDTEMKLEDVWDIFKPLLSPIVTPDKLELPPLRELNELCDSLGYFIKEKVVTKGDMVQAELRLQLKDVLLVGEGCERNKKLARGQAALHLLKDLESRGISFSKRRKQAGDNVDPCGQTSEQQDSSPKLPNKKQKMDEIWLPADQMDISSLDHSLGKESSLRPANGIPVIVSIDMRKGGARTSLYEVCKKLLWPKPSFISTEHKSKTPIELEGCERKECFNSFVSRITLHIPSSGVIELTGNAKADKKSSLDSAALLMLYELESQGKVQITAP